MKRKKKAARWFIPFGMAFAVGSAVVLPKILPGYIRRLPVTVRELQVQGEKALSAVDLKKLAGIKEGAPLLGSWMTDSANKVRENPRVANVAVMRDVTGQVAIRVTERKPVALVNLDRLYYIDGQGNILDAARFDSQETAGLMIITGPWSAPRSGWTEGAVRETLVNGLRLNTGLLSAGFEQKKISELHYDGKRGWVVYHVGGGAPAVIGWDRFEDKAARLLRVLKDFEQKESAVKEIDLDFRDRAVVKLRGNV